MFRDIELERLTLRTLTFEDAEAIYNYRKNKKNFPFVQMNEYKSVEEAYRYIELVNKSDEWKVYGIELKENSMLIGTISIWNFNEEKTIAEIGYGLFPLYRGKGYMKEAINGVVNFCLNELSLKQVEAYTGVENLSSNKLLESCNFEFLKVIEEKSPANGENTEMNVYKINKK